MASLIQQQLCAFHSDVFKDINHFRPRMKAEDHTEAEWRQLIDELLINWVTGDGD
jgi:hypothetical protein